MRLVVENGTNGRVVGYGTLWDDPGLKDTCYVQVLNVHPAHQRRSLARRMLTQMVDWATDNGYRRMTIETWPGNLKSVPLYKKVGFFWTPDTNVYMENFIPGIRQLPIARRFFERHDWYATFGRELEQIEDDQRYPVTGDMKVYVCRWEQDGEFLQVVIDRQSQEVTGLETEHLSVFAIVDEGEPAQGIVYPVRWRVVNKQAESVDVSVLAHGEPSIELDYRASFVLAAGQERIIEAAYTCMVDAPPLDADKTKSVPKIKTALVIDGRVVELGTGLRYHPAVEISAEPEFPSLLPGQSQTIHLQLQNRLGRAADGIVAITPQEGLTTDWLRHDLHIEANSYAGLPLTVTCDQAGARPLFVTTTFADGDCQVTMAPQRIPLLVTPLGGVAADINEDKLVIENDFFQLTCRAKGGYCQVRNKALQRREARISEEVGPPFKPWDLYEKRYDLALEHGQGWAKATLTAKSGDFPGLMVAREITVTASPLIQVRYRVVNAGLVAHTFQVRPNVGLSDRDEANVALPRQERLVSAHAAQFPSAHGDFPKMPEGMAEQWIALSREGQAAGAIWNTDVTEHEFGWGHLALYFAEGTLEPQSATNIGPFYLYLGPGDWRDVRRVWQRTAGVTVEHFQAPPAAPSPHAFDLLPAPLVAMNGQVGARLGVDTVREHKMEGRIIIEPPPGWALDRAEFPVESVALGKPLVKTLQLTATDGQVGAAEGRVRLETALFDEARPFTVIRLGDQEASVRVQEVREADQPLWVIASGRYSWTVAPSFHGGVIGWREAASEVNHLMTAFPDNGELGWLKPWFGGIWPMLMPARDRGQGWPGKLHEETFSAMLFQTADERRLLWHGLQLTASLKREGLEGLRAEIAYLTVGNSNVLKVVFRLVNETSGFRRTLPGLLAFFQVDGQHENALLCGHNLQRKRTSQMAWPLVGSWGAVVNPSTGRATVMVAASGRKRIELADWGVDGGHLAFNYEAVLPPYGSHELVAYLALTGSLDEAKRYRCLASF
jgi:hypothetical protein